MSGDRSVTPTNIVLIGGGGHAAVCLDVLRSGGAHPVGYVAHTAGALDLEHLGGDETLDHLDRATTSIFVAIGDNRRRWTLIEEVRSRGFRLATAISAHAVVSPSASIGVGSVLMPGCIVNAHSRLGDGVIVNTAASVDHDGDIGDAVHLAPGCHLAGNVTVGHGSFLGVGTSVIPQRTIGSWSVLGAGSVVVHDIPADCTAYGVPARVR